MKEGEIKPLRDNSGLNPDNGELTWRINLRRMITMRVDPIRGVMSKDAVRIREKMTTWEALSQRFPSSKGATISRPTWNGKRG